MPILGIEDCADLIIPQFERLRAAFTEPESRFEELAANFAQFFPSTEAVAKLAPEHVEQGYTLLNEIVHDLTVVDMENSLKQRQPARIDALSGLLKNFYHAGVDLGVVSETESESEEEN